jgi:hypothetical protein
LPAVSSLEITYSAIAEELTVIYLNCSIRTATASTNTTMSTPESSILDHLDSTTIFSLLVVVIFLNSSYILSISVLAPSTPKRLRILFIWHAFDFLIHTIFEGSFLYNCFFTSTPFNPATHHPTLINNFLGQPDKLFGAAYGDNWATKLWMVYAQADKRWGGADLTVISLELLTVFGAGPLALYICYQIQRRDPRVAFWMIVLATGELYGGMSFSNLSMLLFHEMDTDDANCRLHDFRPRMVDR